MDWPIFILGIVSISFFMSIIALPIISGYYGDRYISGVHLFVMMVAAIAFYLTIIWVALVVSYADVLLLIFFGITFMSLIASPKNREYPEGYLFLVNAYAYLLLLIYMITITMLISATGWEAINIIIGIIIGICGLIFVIILTERYLVKKFDTYSRLKNIGSRLRENKELQIMNKHRMNEFRTNLKQWEAEEYSGLKDIIALKNFDQMEWKFNEAEQKIKKLKAVESTLKKLSQDFPNERAVFELEMESIRKKCKDFSNIDEIERKIKNLSSALTEYHQLKNEILDRIAKVVKSET